MKILNYLKTALVLTLITAICAALIAIVNIPTSEKIIENAREKKERLCQEIFADYSIDASPEAITSGFESEYIVEKIEAYDSSSNFLGYIYTVKGNNSYGAIELLVGISSDGTLVSVEFITNGQSFSSETEAHVNGSYVSGLDSTEVNNIDVNCGATYAAKLVKELVSACFNDSQGGSW